MEKETNKTGPEISDSLINKSLNWRLARGEEGDSYRINQIKSGNHTFNIPGRGFRKKNVPGASLGALKLSHCYTGRRDNLILVLKQVDEIVSIFGVRKWTLEIPLSDLVSSEGQILEDFVIQSVAMFEKNNKEKAEREKKEHNLMHGAVDFGEQYESDELYGMFS